MVWLIILFFLTAVFKRKVLEFHHYGEGSDDASTTTTWSPVTTATEPKDTTRSSTTSIQDRLDDSIQEAIGILTTHQRFMEKQRTTLADQRRKRSLELPRTVSSKRLAEGVHTGGASEGIGGAEGGEDAKGGKGCGQREVTHAEKNRKRKLKKRKAKEKQFKHQET